MNGNDLANPVKYLFGEEFYTAGGLTKREFIAAMAMQGLLANSDLVNGSTTNLIADWAVDHADALIERLNADPAEGVNLLPMYSRELDEGLDNDQDRGVSR
jgi:hypothetical protein